MIKFDEISLIQYRQKQQQPAASSSIEIVIDSNIKVLLASLKKSASILMLHNSM